MGNVGGDKENRLMVNMILDLPEWSLRTPVLDFTLSKLMLSEFWLGVKGEQSVEAVRCMWKD